MPLPEIIIELLAMPGLSIAELNMLFVKMSVMQIMYTWMLYPYNLVL